MTRRVGDDPPGERVTREIRAEECSSTSWYQQAPTGLILKDRPSASSTAVFYYRAESAGSRLQPADVPHGWIENAEIVHLSKHHRFVIRGSAGLWAGSDQSCSGRGAST